MTYRDASRKLKRVGCVELPRTGGGAHCKWQNPATGRSAVLPNWGGKDLKLGTLRAALKQLGIDWSSFEAV